MKGVPEQLVCSETTARRFPSSEFLVRCGGRGDGRDSDVSDKTNQKLCRGRRLVRAAVKFATQLLDTGGLFVWEWPRGCQAWELPEMKHVSDALWKSTVVFLIWMPVNWACETRRDKTTRMLVRKGSTFMTNSESLHKILNMRCIITPCTLGRKKHTQTLTM